MNQKLEDKLIVFGTPIGLMLLCDFMVLTMQFGQPFCLDCFTNGWWHSNSLIPFFIGYGLIVFILNRIMYHGMFSNNGIKQQNRRNVE